MKNWKNFSRAQAVVGRPNPAGLTWCLLLALAGLAHGVGSAATHAAEPPRLAVVISLDQLRADYLTRFRPYFGEGGFKRLLEGGAVFADAHHRYAVTLTAPGHASMLSGVFPETHGVVANAWLDRERWEVINSVEDGDSPLVGVAVPHSPGNILARKAGRSPKNFRATTVGDQLKLRFGDGARVFSASNKDRSAILLGGKLADQVYWTEQGAFVTSRYYRAALPDWVRAFNDRRLAANAIGRTWERLLPAAVYDQLQGPDDVPGESDEHGLTRTFPKTIRSLDAYDLTPFASEELGAFVQQAVREEKLGRRSAPDLLCVSFSQIDSAGHAYGPDSHEMMDSVIRLDRVLAGLFDCLDQEVGLQHCLIVLTADHGVCPMPERVQRMSDAIPAGRIVLADVEAAARRALDAAFGSLPDHEYWFTRYNTMFHLRASALAAKQIDAASAAAVVRDALLTLDCVDRAYTRSQMLALPSDGDSAQAMIRRSYDPRSGGEVFYTVRPYFFVQAAGSAHGSPHHYDTHVPLIWFGPGIRPGVHLERIGIDDLAPTLAALLQVPVPPQARGRRLF